MTETTDRTDEPRSYLLGAAMIVASWALAGLVAWLVAGLVRVVLR